MGKNKTDGKAKGKAKGKDGQLVIRIDKAEREAFVSLCDALDTSAAREIRRFMRGFVATHAKGQVVAPAPAAMQAEAIPDAPAPDRAPLVLIKPVAPFRQAPDMPPAPPQDA